MGILYFVALAISLACMALIDRRWKLFFWRDARSALIVLVVGVLFFLLWDIAGISQGVFFRGETEFMTGLQIAPELPVEEVFFLTLLCYLTMNMVNGFGRIADRKAAKARAKANA
ncbi:lycopene cyclase domain-containing protein [Planctomonas psychrotolerans]|uniref:lycopene cyclase domain-containing protein n=1 Tax=Planctomonas psychrotolerans TaxID=2528712 RepID=UPI001239B4C4|nr:lycopene cyclase domain-containing protein [Planctomonas psychrotolerans]